METTAKEMKEIAKEKRKEIRDRNFESIKRQLMAKISTAAYLGLFKVRITLKEKDVEFVNPSDINYFLTMLGYSSNYRIEPHFKDMVLDISWE